MREYRAKRKDDDIFVYGSFVKTEEKKCWIVDYFDGNDENSLLDTTCYEVEEKTAGQFIGIHDVDNRMIYSGDILQANGLICSVEYCKESASYGVRYYDTPILNKISLLVACKCTLKKLGNIYDDYGLLPK